MSVEDLWSECVAVLEQELSKQLISTWIRPLQAEVNGTFLHLFAPNRFVLRWVQEKYSDRLQLLVKEKSKEQVAEIVYAVGDKRDKPVVKKVAQPKRQTQAIVTPAPRSIIVQDSFQTTLNKLAEQQEQQAVVNTVREAKPVESAIQIEGAIKHSSTLNPLHTFDSLVEGKSNQLARAASFQVAENPGAYNPLFIYGGVGLGKTHLMHAVGNQIMQLNPSAKVVYLNSERFVQDMVKALQLNAINEFKRFYRSLDALLIDDIQFFVGKDRSQEEFFYTFNSLLEGGKQIILTSDRFPKEIGVEERLKSRFGWGLTVAIEPPELELRVAILLKKAATVNVHLPQEVAFFIAQKIRSHVRDLEGALNRVIADAHFKGQPITIDLVRESLKDLFAVQDKQVGIENIQRVVADYYKIKIADLHSKRRTRSIARPRQVAMALAKELTNHSLPEIGDAFGGRDHTTVLHACRRVKALQDELPDIREDWKNLLRLLTS